jgi:FkbM family methyltransferase
MIIAGYLRDIGYRPQGIVHVGAHAAQEMQEYLTLEPKLIVWVEADPVIFAELEKAIPPLVRLGPPSQLCLNALVGARDDEVILFHRFSNRGASSSIFRATPLLQKTWLDVVETGEVVPLTSHRLDSLLSKENLKPDDIDVLIFDIQGSELLALNGSGEFLKAARFVEVEVSQDSIYDGAPLAPDVDAFLRAADFEQMTEVPWHGDVVYRRR